MTDTRYIDCDDHGPKRRAYIVCKHLLEKPGKAVLHHFPWTDEDNGMGEVICAIPPEQHRLEDLKVFCEDHLIELGLIRPGETRLT